MKSTVLGTTNMYFANSIYILVVTLVTAFIIRFLFEDIFKGIFKKTRTNIDDKIIGTVKTPVFLSVILIGSHFFVLTLNLTDNTDRLLTNLILTIGAFIWSLSLAQIIQILLKAYDSKHPKDTRLSDALPFLESLIVFTFLGIAFAVALDLWGVNITPLIASAGVAGIGVAFAAKDTISNLFGGISVFFDQPYKVGDFVIIEEKYRGKVVSIGMRSTKIRTRDNVLITIPNSVMVTNPVINETGFDPKLRIRVPVGVSYDSDLERVEHVTKNVLKKDKRVLDKPAPTVRFRSFGDSSINLEALGVIEEPSEKGTVTHDLIKEIHKSFKEEGISIPYPQRDVHITKDKA